MNEDKKQAIEGEKTEVLTLKGYYRALPRAIFPKQQFVEDIAKKCGVTQTAVRNWIMYGFHPKNIEHVRILSQATGIPMNELWID